MSIASNKKVWLSGAMMVHYNPLIINLIKYETETNAEKYLIKIISCSNSVTYLSDMYEFNMLLLRMYNHNSYYFLNITFIWSLLCQEPS